MCKTDKLKELDDEVEGLPTPATNDAGTQLFSEDNNSSSKQIELIDRSEDTGEDTAASTTVNPNLDSWGFNNRDGDDRKAEEEDEEQESGVGFKFTHEPDTGAEYTKFSVANTLEDSLAAGVDGSRVPSEENALNETEFTFDENSLNNASLEDGSS